ncbi:MAG: four helix bundle protein [Kiritimatiellia bacterium]|jgi:four helix bundle protein|nr:four helix bundle protein [Kiritimatiellia bacterium]
MRKFEEIEAWQLSRELVREIYRVSREGALAKDFGLQDQIRRAAVSIMSNIAEGFERGGNKEFVNFLSIAKGSCGEVRSQLYVAFDQGYVDQAQFASIVHMCVRVSVMLQAFITSVRTSDFKGPRYK